MNPESNQIEKQEPTEVDWLEVVKQKAAKLRFGSIQITVHDGRVTQVESIEKTRFVPRSKES